MNKKSYPATKLVRFDWAMKKILRNKANFRILEGFLSELLGQNIKIIQLLESESNQEESEDKFNRVDLLVENESGELIIIEVQNQTELDYLQRLIYGTSKVLVEHIKMGESYSEIKRVISISIIYFDLGQGEDYIYAGNTDFVGLHLKDRLELSEAQKLAFSVNGVRNLFPQYYLIKVKKFVCAQNFTEKILQIRKFRLPSPYKSMFLSFFLWINNLSTL